MKITTQTILQLDSKQQNGFERSVMNRQSIDNRNDRAWYSSTQIGREEQKNLGSTTSIIVFVMMFAGDCCRAGQSIINK
jgi:hypothetical protein